MGIVGTGSITLFDQNDMLYASLSSDDVLVPVDSSGTPKTSLSSSPLTTQIVVYKGSVLQTGWTFSRIQSNATSTINAATGAVSVTAVSADVAYVEITAIKSGHANLVKRFTITKVYQGLIGNSGVNGRRTAVLEMFKWAATTPTLFPTGSSNYTWATGIFTTPSILNGWTVSPSGATAGYTLYACRVVYSDTGTSTTSSIIWPTTGQLAYPVGAAGPPGTPNQLGIIASGLTLSIKGFDSNRNLVASSGLLTVPGKSECTVIQNSITVTLPNSGTGFLLVDTLTPSASVVRFAKLQPNGSSYYFKDFVTGTTITTNQHWFSFGRFSFNGSTFQDIQLTSATTLEGCVNSRLMEIMQYASLDDTQFIEMATAIGMERAFSKIAILEAFINKLIANNLKVGSANGFQFNAMKDSLGDGSNVAVFDVKMGATQLMGINTSNGDISFGENTTIKASGTLSAKNAELIGTLQTGINAATDARVAIRDASGITAKSSAAVTGVDDLAIIAQGSVAGNFLVKITSVAPVYNVGGIGPAGGIIFHKIGNQYYECAPVASEWTGKVWGGYQTLVGGTLHTVGSGQANTLLIVAKFGTAEPYAGKTDYAAKICNDLVLGGFSDWFLPSRNELTLMYSNLKQNSLGGFSNTCYWSSSETTMSLGAYVQDFTQGTEWTYNKYEPYRVRAIRSFTAPDTFKWSSNNGSSWSSDIPMILGGTHDLTGFNITIAFASPIGHTLNDTWSFSQGSMRGMSVMDTNGLEYVSANNGVLATKQLNLPGTTNIVYGAVFN